MTARPMHSRAARMAVGEHGQKELALILEAEGFAVVDVGQESWLPAELHELIRHDHTDRMVRAVRYQPDLLAMSVRFKLSYWDAKINTVSGTNNFTIERACYEEQLARAQKGERVVLAFRDTDGAWRAQWAQRLEVVADHSDRRHEAQGSHTPYLLIAKSSTLALRAFIALQGTSG